MNATVGAIICALLVGNWCMTAGQETKSLSILYDEELLRYLPANSIIDQIPTVFDEKRRVTRHRQGIIPGDTDGDGTEEIVVAYCTPPHKDGPGICRCAHIKVLDWDGVGWREQWDSGGWGIEFIARMPREIVNADAETQRAYSRNFFDVRDINGDDLPDILFTRASFLAEGDRFEAWTWDGVYYQRIAVGCEPPVRIEHNCIISEFGYKGIKREEPWVFTWDGAMFAGHIEAKTPQSSQQ